MKVSGFTIEQREKVSSFMWMETYLMVIGCKTRQMDMECTSTLMELSMRVIGRMICRMGWVRKHGQMGLHLRGSIGWGGRRGVGITFGRMGVFTRGSGWIIG